MEQISDKTIYAGGVVVFGAGNLGKWTAFILRNSGISGIYCFDNDSKKWGLKLFDCLYCERPRLIGRRLPVLIAIENREFKREIGEQCLKLGYEQIYEVDATRLRKETDHLSDKEYLELLFYLRIGKELNINCPKTFNEKLQWLKLYDQNPKYIRMTDKLEAKEYVAEIIGEKYIIPTLGKWDKFEEVDFKNLPNEFVLKCTHDSGSATIITDKDRIDYQCLKLKYENALCTNHYKVGREWVYKDIKPRIIAEKYLGNANRYKGDIVDYKLMCFNGKVKCSFTCTERFLGKDKLKVTFYDEDWVKLPFERHYAADTGGLNKPSSYNEMVKLAEQLAQDIPFARIDFYEMDKQPYFGEITLYPGSGFEEFTPAEWDRKLGDWLELPERGKYLEERKQNV
jgi:hypothetical protein